LSVKSRLFQCVPNFSEGQRPEVIEKIACSIQEAEADLRDYSADADHNRCVMTILGDEDTIYRAVMASSQVAVREINLQTHQGVHPRTGAIDVVPVVPLCGATIDDAITLADRIAQGLAGELNLPVFLYEKSAKEEQEMALPMWRRGRYKAFSPDYGPGEISAKSGIVIVGAREPLVAYNINLKTQDVKIAKAIARMIREERDTNSNLEGVRSLGLYLPTAKKAQVSMNLTRPEKTPLPYLFDFIKALALHAEVEVEESEIIGVIPPHALAGESPERILWHTYKPTQILSSEEFGNNA